jgi:hypothetical protein
MRWKPKTEDDIASLIASGDLDESHHLDAKREVGQSKAAHKETARDLASFAIDGGALIIGVGENDDHTFYCSPIDVDSGIVERLEQIAANTVRPPLDIRVDVIRAEAGGGYLFVTIPASPGAPHMADGRYYGRVSAPDATSMTPKCPDSSVGAPPRPTTCAGTSRKCRTATRTRKRADQPRRSVTCTSMRDPAPPQPTSPMHSFGGAKTR